jgi:opacity protein-like surface antigen
MKAMIRTALVAAALVLPVASFAQASTITRAQVNGEISQLAHAGYHVGDGDQAQYPANVQRAEAKVAAQDGATSAYGGVADGASQSGSHVSKADWNAMYTR